MRVSLRDRATGKERSAFNTMPIRNTRCWRLSPDGKTVMMGTDGKTVRLWDVASGKELPSLGGHAEQARSCAFGSSSLAVSADGRLIATADINRGKISLYERDTGKALPIIELGQSIRWLAFAPDGKSLFVTGDKGRPGQPNEGGLFLAVWDMARGKEARRIELADYGPQALSREGHLLAAGGRKSICSTPSRDASASCCPYASRAVLPFQQAAGPSGDPELLRGVRAVEVLEWIADPEARKLLDELARGALEARLTREAKAARERLEQRFTSPP